MTAVLSAAAGKPVKDESAVGRDQQFNFANLTPDLLLDALESIGVYAGSGLLALNSYENRVYQFLDDEGTRWVTKFYRPERWSDAQILEEHQFAFELVQQEVPVVAPVLRGGASLFHHNGYRFALYPSRGGRNVELDNLDQLEWIGRFLGRIHTVGSRTRFLSRPDLSLQEVQRSAALLIGGNWLPDGLQRPFEAILEPLLKHLETALAPLGKVECLRLHGDCHASNILWTDGGPNFVDLDDARNGPAVQDLWMLLSGARDEQLMQLDTLLSGYEEFCEFDHRQLALIEPLRAARMINYMAWLARRWQDPAFPLSFPWFNTQKYWEGQILALKEQLAALDEPPLTLFP